MKSYSIILKPLFLSLLTLLIVSCESDDTTETENPEPPFQTVTLDLSGLNVMETDTSFEVNGFTFSNMGGLSQDFSTLNSDDEIEDFNAVGLFSGSSIELDLENVSGISQITARILNNGTSTPVTLLNNGEVIEEVQAPFRVDNVVFDVEGITIDQLRILSFEGAVLSIILE